MSKIAKNAKTMLATLGLDPVKVVREDGESIVIAVNNKTSEVNRAFKAFGGRRDKDHEEGLLFANKAWALPNGGWVGVMDKFDGYVNVSIHAQDEDAVYYCKVASAFANLGVMVTPADVEAGLMPADPEGEGSSISEVFKGRVGRFKRAVRSLMDRKTIAKYTELGYLTFAMDYRLGIGPKRVDGVNVSYDA
ncbi:hypothetical protein D3C86_1637370 [compost metagenome]